AALLLLIAAAAVGGIPEARAQTQAPAPTQTQPPARGPAAATPGKPDAPAAPAAPVLSEREALKGALDVRLAYIVTGDKDVDDISKAGLEGLSEVLRNRTSVEPA